MWEQFGRRSTKRSGGAVALPFGALEKARGRFGWSETRQAQGAFGGAVGIEVGVVAIAATIALVFNFCVEEGLHVKTALLRK